jgi:bifunctional polynucleotide phosphatase/kinase
VIFFTNQAGIEKLKVQPEELQRKIEAIIKELDIPVLVSLLTCFSHIKYKPACL